MLFIIIRGLLYPLLGTVLGSSAVYFLKKSPSDRLMSVLDSVAAGIMCAASFFSLILPALEQAESIGFFSKLSCSIGFFSGILLFIVINKISDRFFCKKDMSGNMLMWAVSLHNIPEGMAVGVVYAGILSGKGSIGIMSALTLSVGIALQNIPEGAIISLPMKARGKKRYKAFLYGFVSGIAELAAGIFSLLFAAFIYSVLPFSLCFAAGAMIYVVLAELSEAFTVKDKSVLALISFDAGFVVMMLLDTFLG